jgi:hypothetical protein
MCVPFFFAVRSLILEKSTDSEPLNFEPIKEQGMLRVLLPSL